MSSDRGRTHPGAHGRPDGGDEGSSDRVGLCPLEELPDGQARRFEVEAGGLVHRIAVVRLGDDLYALGDTCSHADYSLAEGEVDAEEGTIECWKHGSLFSLATGEAETMPAILPVPVYDVGVSGGHVWLDISRDSRDTSAHG